MTTNPAMNDDHTKFGDDGSPGRRRFARLGFRPFGLGCCWVLFCLAAAGLLLAKGLAAPAVEAGASSRYTTTTKKIEDVREGDRVGACDPATGRWSAREVLRPLVHDYHGDVIAVTAGGGTVEATGNHPFWVASGKGLADRPAAADVPEAERQAIAAAARQGRWVEARHLQPGDLLVVRSGRVATVEELSARREKLKVYNLEVADLHTYAVGREGVVVHNKSPGEPFGGGGGPPSGGGNPDELVDVYRGVHADHPDLPDARQGKANPWGGHDDPTRHSAGDVASEFTSWSTDPNVAAEYANRYGKGGVLLHDRVPRSELIRGTYIAREKEWLRQGPVKGATVVGESSGISPARP